jgi:hypothetical protein
MCVEKGTSRAQVEAARAGKGSGLADDVLVFMPVFCYNFVEDFEKAAVLRERLGCWRDGGRGPNRELGGRGIRIEVCQDVGCR